MSLFREFGALPQGIGVKTLAPQLIKQGIKLEQSIRIELLKSEHFHIELLICTFCTVRLAIETADSSRLAGQGRAE